MNADTLLWFSPSTGRHDIPLSVLDALDAQAYQRECDPHTPSTLEHFALWPTALLQAQAWAIPDHCYMPSEAWGRRLHWLSDKGFGRVYRRVTALIAGDILDPFWKDEWREEILPRLNRVMEGR